ncbi:MAG: prolipoprotein diacylglyceryl transferase [Opitutales bacterium]
MFNLFSLNKYVVDFDPFIIKFPEGFFIEGIRWYGFAYLAGFIIGMYLLNLYTKKNRSKLSLDDNSSLVVYMLFGVMIGGRLGYMLFYNLGEFLANPLSLFQVWKGGMASHGGFIGVVIGIALFARKHKLKFFYVGDLIVSVASLGILFGRLANFINGELWGKISDSPLAMIFPNSQSGVPVEAILPRHPSQLYEALSEGLLLFIYMQYRIWRGNLKVGILSAHWLIIYAISRIVCEIFREPDRGISLILGMSRGTFYSVLTLLAGIAILIYVKKNETEFLVK